MTLLRSRPGTRVLLLEKEDCLASHQTGRNSGVIHSGIYYKPGSLKARMAVEGNRSMAAFCETHDIPFATCGKLIAATDDAEVPRLEMLLSRGRENGLVVEKLDSHRAREMEPHLRCVAALRVPSTGIVSYREVARKFATLAQLDGADIRLGCAVVRLIENATGYAIESTGGTFHARFIVGCAGLHGDRLARQNEGDPGARIVPFRGEYYELVPRRRYLVKGLIYPVPDPAFPFLGVHFTRMIDGGVHAGPNAVLAFAREGYRRRDFSWRDITETLGYPGFWKLARKHWDEGCREMWRSFSKRAFVRSLQRLIPEVTTEDLVPCAAGIRAQALRPDGALVDDFLFVRRPNALHVCNAPSPAATASIEIAKAIVEQIPVVERKAVAVA